MCYINNYIDWDQFNQLYDSNWMEKDIRNADVVTCKLRPALIKITNHKLEIAREERQKRDKMMERQKIETIVVRQQRAKRRISSSIKEKKSYGSDTRDETNPDQTYNEYLLPL